jgi:Sulfotransferase family
MALPTFVIIGAMKAGTTSLYYYLNEHPQIQMASVKEANFFSGPPNGVPYPTGLKRVEHLEDYEQLFDPAVAARGEASPSYTVYPRRKGVPERIKDLVPDAKLVYLVRDPVARTVSQYQHHVSYEGERRSIEEALGDLADPCGRYTSPSFYAAQLERYLRHFSSENILVVDQADLLAERKATLREIFAFLGVDDSFYSRQFEEEMNTGAELRTYSRFVVLVRYARSTPLQRLPRGLRVFLRKTVRRIVSRPLEKPPLSDDLRRRLQELYAEDARRLRELTGKTFSTWSV